MADANDTSALEEGVAKLRTLRRRLDDGDPRGQALDAKIQEAEAFLESQRPPPPGQDLGAGSAFYHGATGARGPQQEVTDDKYHREDYARSAQFMMGGAQAGIVPPPVTAEESAERTTAAAEDKRNLDATREAHPWATAGGNAARGIAASLMVPGAGLPAAMLRGATTGVVSDLARTAPMDMSAGERLGSTAIAGGFGALAGLIPIPKTLGALPGSMAAGGGVAAAEEGARAVAEGRPITLNNMLMAGALGAGFEAIPGGANVVRERVVRRPGTAMGEAVRAAEEMGGRTHMTKGLDIPSVRTAETTAGALGRPGGDLDARVTVDDPGMVHNVLGMRAGNAALQETAQIDEALRRSFATQEEALKATHAQTRVNAAPLLDKIDELVQGRSFEGTATAIDDQAVAGLKRWRDKLHVETPESMILGPNGAPMVPASTAPRDLSIGDLIELRRELDQVAKQGQIAGRDEAPFRRLAGEARELLAANAGDLAAVMSQRHKQLSRIEAAHDALVGVNDAEIDPRAARDVRVASTIAKYGSLGSAADMVRNRQVSQAMQDITELGQAAGIQAQSPETVNMARAAAAREFAAGGTPRVTTSPGRALGAVANAKDVGEQFILRFDPVLGQMVRIPIVPATMGVPWAPEENAQQ